MSDVLSVQRLIPSPPEPIFDLLVDPAGHSEIDGGGTVKGARSGGRRLEENRRIAWQTTASGPAGSLLGGRIWRYVIEPVEGGTLVTESWDLTQERVTSKFVVKATMTDATKRNMERTLARIEELVTSVG